MNQKVKTALIIVITFSVTTVFYSLFGDKFKKGELGELTNKIDLVNSYIDGHYLYDDIDYSELNEAAVTAYVDALEEPYTHYYTKDDFEDYVGSIEESYTGIGVVISVDAQEDMIIVLSPFIDSPAYKAGIMPGDYILAVDGTEYSGNDMHECVNHIKNGKAGTSVRLTIIRDGKTQDIDVIREEITENSVSSEMLTNDIGYISITNFNMSTDNSDTSTYTEFVKAISLLEEKGMKKLIIDLRDNPGGVMDEVINVADFLLPEGVITYTETRNGKRSYYRSDEDSYNVPIVVLINNNSASASEILTGALKDFDCAEVVGEKTYGKGIVQRVYPFLDGSGMSITVAKYFTPSGISIHEVGVEPDYTVELPEQYEGMYAMSVPRSSDTQLQKAVQILNNK